MDEKKSLNVKKWLVIFTLILVLVTLYSHFYISTLYQPQTETSTTNIMQEVERKQIQTTRADISFTPRLYLVKNENEYGLLLDQRLYNNGVFHFDSKELNENDITQLSKEVIALEMRNDEYTRQIFDMAMSDDQTLLVFTMLRSNEHLGYEYYDSYSYHIPTKHLRALASTLEYDSFISPVVSSISPDNSSVAFELDACNGCDKGPSNIFLYHIEAKNGYNAGPLLDLRWTDFMSVDYKKCELEINEGGFSRCENTRETTEWTKVYVPFSTNNKKDDQGYVLEYIDGVDQRLVYFSQNGKMEVLIPSVHDALPDLPQSEVMVQLETLKDDRYLYLGTIFDGTESGVHALYVYDSENGTLTKMKHVIGYPQFNPILSPDGTKIAYVKDHFTDRDGSLYVLDLVNDVESIIHTVNTSTEILVEDCGLYCHADLRWLDNTTIEFSVFSFSEAESQYGTFFDRIKFKEKRVEDVNSVPEIQELDFDMTPILKTNTYTNDYVSVDYPAYFSIAKSRTKKEAPNGGGTQENYIGGVDLMGVENDPYAFAEVAIYNGALTDIIDQTYWFHFRDPGPDGPWTTHTQQFGAFEVAFFRHPVTKEVGGHLFYMSDNKRTVKFSGNVGREAMIHMLNSAVFFD